MADFAGRERIAPDGKVAIGRAAAKMIQSGQVVILDGGTTARQLARHLPPDLRATIITHSPTIALELVNHLNVEVILIGGRLFRHSVVAVGAAAIEAIAQVHADIYFMGVTGVHPKAGLTFAGEGNGLFKAYDAKTGTVLWSFQAGAGVNAAPMGFTIDGKPYIAVAAGGNFQLSFKNGTSVLVFGLE